MFYGSGGGGFELKSLQVYRVEVVIYFEDLDGYEIAYLPTAGAVDIGHSAFADQIFEFVFAFQDAAYQQISTRMPFFGGLAWLIRTMLLLAYRTDFHQPFGEDTPDL